MFIIHRLSFLGLLSLVFGFAACQKPNNLSQNTDAGACLPLSSVQINDEIAQNNPLEALKKGNQAFLQELERDPLLKQKLLENKKGQHPFAVVVSCSDSRVPPSIIFHQSLGNLFIIRTAGNIVGNIEMGSIEYAISHLNSKLIIVMGHTHCGAIEAYAHHEQAPEHIKEIIDSLEQEPEIQALKGQEGQADYVEHCIHANVEHVVKHISKGSEIIKNKIKRKELQIIGAVYDIDTGIVGFK